MSVTLYFPSEIALPQIASSESQKNINVITLAKYLKIFSHHSTPIPHGSGFSVIITTQNPLEFNFVYSTETSVVFFFKKKLSVSSCMVALYLNQKVC